MSYDTLYVIELIGIIGCVLFLAISVAMFFLFKIPKVVGDITGSTAKKAISNIEYQNSNTEVSMYNRPKLSSTAADKSTMLNNKKSVPAAPNKIGVTTAELKISNTKVNGLMNETELLVSTETSGETEILADGYMSQTELLGDDVASSNMDKIYAQKTFEIVNDITLVNSSEIII